MIAFPFTTEIADNSTLVLLFEAQVVFSPSIIVKRMKRCRLHYMIHSVHVPTFLKADDQNEGCNFSKVQMLTS